MAITQAKPVSGLSRMTGGGFPSGSRTGGGGLTKNGGSNIPGGSRVGGGGLARTGSVIQSGARTGAGGLAKSGSAIPSGSRVGGGGLTKSVGSNIPSGARTGAGGLAKSGSAIPSGSRVGSGGLSRSGSAIPSGRRVGSGGLTKTTGSNIPDGSRVGSGGLARNPGSNIPSGNRTGSGGLRFPSLNTTKTGSGGGIRRSSSPSRTGLGGGRRPAGGGGGSRGNTYTPPIFIHVICGVTVSGEFVLNVEEDFDPDTGLPLPLKVNAFKAVINEKEWTPENVTEWIPTITTGNVENTDTRRISEYSGGWSDNCAVTMDYPLSNGRILKIDHINLAIPNGDTFSPEEAVTNDTPGTRVAAEEMIYLPS